MSKLLKVFLISLLVGVVIGLSGAGVVYYYMLRPQFHPDTTTYIYIDEDDTLDSVYYKISQEGNPSSMKGFRWISEYKKYGDRVRTGKYAIQPDDNAYKLYQRLSAGQQTPVNITVGSVRTFDKLARNIGNQIMADSTDIAKLLNDPEYISGLGYDEQSLYSLFIPNTYEVYWNIDAEEFFQRMLKEHNRFWNQDRQSKAQNIGLTPAQVSTLASIVDEETNANSEKPTVAGLYLNRLKRGMPLQADPTVKFALGDFEARRVTNAMLEADSPYNTYKYAGLPPGPIRIPSIQGIDAVLNYQQHNYLYMCAKEDFSGTHNFATTLTEHLANARKYHKALNDRNIFR